MNIKLLVGEVKWKGEFFRKPGGWGRFLSTEDGMMPILRVAWKFEW